MKILARSVFDSFLTAFLLSFLVISAVLTVGLLVPMAGYFMKGAASAYLLRLVAVGFHESLQLTVPISLFVSSVFVFARLGEDGELDAMRACGLRLASVAAGPLVLAALLSGLFVWVNDAMLPREHEMRRRLKTALFIDSGFRLVNPRETVDEIANMRFRFDGRDGDTMLGLLVQDSRDPNVTRLLTADRANVDLQARHPNFGLEGMKLEPLDAAGKLNLRAERLRYRLKRDLRAFTYRRTNKDRTMAELIAHARDRQTELRFLASRPPDTPWLPSALAYNRQWITVDRLEIVRRIVYALASFCFVFLGVAFGARVRRSGMARAAAYALVAILAYYLVVLTGMSLEDLPAIHPEIVVGLAPVAALAVGFRLWRGL